MKDFDFDELDRAVSSVLTKKQSASNDQASTDAGAVGSDSATVLATPIGDVGTTVATTTQADAQAIDTSVAADTDVVANTDSASSSYTPEDVVAGLAQDALGGESGEQLVVGEPATTESIQPTSAPIEGAGTVFDGSAAEPSQNLASAASISPVPPKRGRFMDMVRPSSVATAPRPSSMSHHAETVMPSDDFVTEPMNQTASPEPRDDATSIDENTDVESIPGSDNSSAGDESDSQQTQSVGDLPRENDESISADSALEAIPIATPFIPDVPVEKRPLNTLDSDSQDTVHGEDSAVDEVLVDSSTEPPAIDSPVAESQELSQEMMDVEGDESLGRPEDVESPATSPSDTQGNELSSGMPFIAQQYKAPEEKSDEDAHRVFDAATYHQPLPEATAKHVSAKTSWLFISIILLLVGAALGVLYFLYGQQ